MHTADDNSKIISQAIQLSLALYISKSVLYFNSIIISNQLKYYLARNRASDLWQQLELASELESDLRDTGLG